MEIHEQIIRGILANAYKMADGEVTELLKKTDGNEILTTILELDKTRVGDISTRQFQDGFKKAKKETLSEFEKSLHEKYAIDNKSLQGEDLINAIVEKHIADVRASDEGKAPKKGEITEDDIKKHPLYLSLENAAKKAVEDKEKEYQAKLSEQENSFNKERSFTSIVEKAQNAINSGKYVFPENAEIATNQKSWFINDLKGYDYETADNQTYVIKDGKRLEDGHGHAVTVDSFIENRAASFFPIRANNGGGNAGNDNNAGKDGNGNLTLSKPKTADELAAIVNDKSIPLEERIKITNEFNSIPN